MAALLSVSGLHLTFSVFEGHAHVINGVDLEVNRGERVAIVGESGCGKSVTARIILGLLGGRKTRISGSVRFDGIDLLSLSKRRWRQVRGRRISMIFQDPSAALNPVFTIGDQLSTAILRGGTAGDRKSALAIASDMLLKVAIGDPDRVLASYPFQLSGGLNQRVLISMALVNNPDLVLADEPGTALDVTVQEQTLHLMSELTRDNGAAVLLITHNLGVVREFAERVYVMYAGTVVEAADTATIFKNPLHPYTRALIEAVPRLSGGTLPRGIDGNVPDYIEPPSGCRFHPRCPHAREVCRDPVAMRPVGDGHRVACVLYDPVSSQGLSADG